MNELKAKTRNHAEYIRAICENDYVLASGPPGCGKTFISTGMACQSLKEKRVDKIIVTRPMVQSGRDTIGYLKGTLMDKVYPFMIPVFDHLHYFLGKELTKKYLEDEVIQIVPLELARGMNFYRSFVIGDEFQNADYDQIKMILTRICKGSKIVLNGDLKQSDLQLDGACDFGLVIDRLRGMQGLEIIELTNRDIMRSKMISRILNRLEV